MPIKVQNNLPAIEALDKENIFVMNENRAITQDIRPLEIIILNLMPTKIVTETQLMRVLGNTPLQINAHFMRTSTYNSKNTPLSHLRTFYKTLDEVAGNNYDGMIVTGAPVETLEFRQVEYWDELCSIMEWSKTHVTSTFYICWAAQAGLYYFYGVPKYSLPKKIFGVFEHVVPDSKKHKILMRGFDDKFYAPHSRYTEVREQDIEKIPNLEILAKSDEAGIYIVTAKNERQFFVTGHSEYDRLTLGKEYFRDVDKGINVDIPKNYFLNNNPENEPVVTWRAHSNLLYSNWLNYFVYQTTPYNIGDIK